MFDFMQKKETILDQEGLEKVLYMFVSKLERRYLHEPKSDNDFKTVSYTSNDMDNLIKEFSGGDVR